MIKSKSLRAVCWIALIAASVSLFRSTLGQATDFLVFWQVGQSLMQHLPFYADNPGAPGMVFKYPPWVALLFYPFGLIDFVSAKGLWALVEILSLFSVIWTLRRVYRASEWAILTLFALYWGIWVIHFLDGQIILPMLALFLHFMSGPRFGAWGPGVVPIVMSAKVFTLFPLLAVWRRLISRRAIFGTLMLGLALTWGAARLSYEGRPLHMLQEWAQAATSGAQQLNSGQTRGSKNQSLVSWICRNAGVAPEDSRTEIAISLGLYLLAFLMMRTRRRSANEELFCYLALTAPLHPLPWHHLYVFTFPLAVLCFDRDRKKPAYWVAIGLICLSSARALPIGGVGQWLEWNVGRAWGAILLVMQAIWMNRETRVPTPDAGPRHDRGAALT